MKSLALIAIVPVALMADSWDDWRSWSQVDHETIQRSFTVGSGANLEVDNVSGFVHVTGYDGNKIEINVNKEARARNAEELARSKRDVKLDITQSGNAVRLYVDGPWRSHDGINYRGDNYYGYHVNYDYEIRVPRATKVDLHTVNNGDIEVKDTNGDFSVHGLNGGIDLENIGGSGDVHTLNGKVRVKFARNPQRDCNFHTLNGPMDIYFQTPLNADLEYHTLNGGVFADFDVSTSGSGYLQRGGGRREHNARAGAGGPHLSFHALNGPIRLHTTTL